MLQTSPATASSSSDRTASGQGSDVRITRHEKPFRVLIANAKGGCGKTTLATNLASFFAARQLHTALIDYDPQASASDWLKARGHHLPTITGVCATRRSQTTATRSWEMRVPSNTAMMIIDTPAGLTGHALGDRIRQSDAVIIPVLPSAIDIRAATTFIRDVMLSPVFRQSPRAIAVVANRTRQNTLIYTKLNLFLKSLGIPFITTLRDTQRYVRTSELGQGIIDDPLADARDLAHWEVLLQWLESTRTKSSPGSHYQTDKPSP
ncbi:MULTISPECIES: ParA family protein [unclassified Oceanobacter]|uniref:ParA family protein n=1 Tax=unclassified Oceanobacter TaxID=2620260 RepID=UPI0027376BC6|nr:MULTISPECIES: ParA family protein [unclassified Oceanobacter]MDP2607844.1 ParA family protein [Oceanobacter sp. 1_MG-2023]MDP2610972.1 ParA family protein [Oceanobacter sp. 2_MG-2023]